MGWGLGEKGERKVAEGDWTVRRAGGGMEKEERYRGMLPRGFEADHVIEDGIARVSDSASGTPIRGRTDHEMT
jgi:hypothetical protein